MQLLSDRAQPTMWMQLLNDGLSRPSAIALWDLWRSFLAITRTYIVCACQMPDDKDPCKVMFCDAVVNTTGSGHFM